MRGRERRRSRSVVLLIVGILPLCWPPGAFAQAEVEPSAVARQAADGASARVEQPERAFGRMLGDVLLQRVGLADGEAIASGTLPPEGRLDAWFARLPAAIVRDEAGRHHLELRYQIVNSPSAATTVSLPATELTLTAGGTLTVPAWPVAIVPLRAEASGVDARASEARSGETSVAGDALPAMRPDRLLPPVDTTATRARARSAAIALAAVSVLWGLWWVWRGRRDAVRLPFSRALSELRSLDAGRREDSPDAWRAAHAAVNATAGHVSGPTAIEALLARAPWLRPYRERLIAFHDASAGRFFEQPPRAEPFALQAFVRDLERAERRAAS